MDHPFSYFFDRLETNNPIYQSKYEHMKCFPDAKKLTKALINFGVGKRVQFYS